MKIDISDKRYSPYHHLSAALIEWSFEHNIWDDLIVDIKTTILGKERIIASLDGCDGYDFSTDWYEGGELELLGITPVNETGEAKYKM